MVLKWNQMLQQRPPLNAVIVVYAAVLELQYICVKKQGNCVSFLSVSSIAALASAILLRHPQVISNDRSVSVN